MKIRSMVRTEKIYKMTKKTHTYLSERLGLKDNSTKQARLY